MVSEQQHGPGMVSVEVDLPPNLAEWVCKIADKHCGGMVAVAIIDILALAQQVGIV